MISEMDALIGMFLVIVIIYFFIMKRSKIIGALALLLTSLSSLIIYGGTDHEMIAWFMIITCFTVAVLEFAFGKMGETKS